MKFLRRNRPQLPLDLVAEILQVNYALSGSLTEFDSERDQNIRVESSEETFLFKVCNEDEAHDVIDMQIRALRHIESVDPAVPTPRALSALDGSENVAVAHEGTEHVVRLMSYLPGELASQPGRDTPGLRRNTGSTLARLDKALASFFHPAAGQDHPWDVMRVPRLLEHVHHIENLDARRDVTAILERVRDETVPRARLLRHQVIHQDAHTGNLVVDPGDPEKITGIIDFGDMVFSPLVVELAIAAHLSGRPDGTPGTVIDLALGFDSVTPLEEAEIEVLFDFVLSRLAMSATIAAARRALFPGDDPYESDEERLWDRIGVAVQARDDVTHEIRDALGFRSTSPGLLEKRVRYMTEHSPHFYRTPLAVESGGGMYLHGEDGTRYLDFYNNVPTVGHNHPQVVNAVSRQLARLNTNTRYLYSAVVDYAERLAGLLDHGLDTCLFVNSGSEANDVASQIVRSNTGRQVLLTVRGSYHGVTQASADLTDHGDVALTEVERISLDFSHRPTNVAGWFIDPALTSNGMPAVAHGALSQLAEHVRAQGGLVVCDEVQAGFGRTGVMWGHEREGIVPDIVTLGKPVGNGVPLGVVVARSEILQEFMGATGLFSTFGGNPVSCAAGLAVIDVVQREGLVDNSKLVGDYLRTSLQGLGSPLIADVRGSGLLVALEFDLDRSQTARVVEGMRERGVLVGTAGPNRNTLKLRPPLIAATSDVDDFLDALDRTLSQHH